MKQKPKTLSPQLHDTKPPRFGGADVPLDFSDCKATAQSVLPVAENAIEPLTDEF